MPEIQRTTITLAPDLHRRIRIWCAEENLRFNAAVNAALEQAFPAQPELRKKKARDQAVA